MRFKRIGVFITTNGGPVEPPANPPEPLRKIIAPIGPNQAFTFDFDTPVLGAWFTPVDSFGNIARFNQIFVASPDESDRRRIQLFVSAREAGASLIGFINTLTCC